MTFVREWIGSIPEVHGDLDDSTVSECLLKAAFQS